jgi:hypothetical protein
MVLPLSDDVGAGGVEDSVLMVDNSDGEINDRHYRGFTFLNPVKCLTVWGKTANNPIFRFVVNFQSSDFFFKKAIDGVAQGGSHHHITFHFSAPSAEFWGN